MAITCAGIVGAGRSGIAKARELSAFDDVRITAVADPSRPARDAFARAFGVRLSVSDHRKLAADEGIDLVYVCSPPATHRSVTVDCLNAGKDVICVPPMAASVADADEMLRAAIETERRLFVALQDRYDPAYQLAAKLIDDDEIGYPFLTLATCLVNDYESLNDWHHWRGTWDVAGGGALIEHGSDLMDMFHYLLGEVDAVSAVCTRFAIEPLHKAEDSCVLGIEFMEDYTAELAITGAARYSTWPERYQGYAVRVEALGLEGSIRISDTEPRLTIVSKKRGQIALAESEIQTGLPTDMNRHFLDCILSDEQPLVTPEQARDALKVVLAAYKSSQMKRRVAMIEYL